MTALELAREHASSSRISVSGSSGSKAAYALACRLVNGYALDESQALEVMREWSTRCLPPWKEQELQHKVSDALRKANHRLPRGHLLGPRHTAVGHTYQSQVEPAKRVVRKVELRKAPSNPPPKTSSAGSSNRPSEGTQEGWGNEKPLSQAPRKPSEVNFPPLGSSTGIPATPLDWTALNATHPPTDEEMNWQAVVDTGFGDDPLILMAFTMFGPGCRVISTGEETA